MEVVSMTYEVFTNEFVPIETWKYNIRQTMEETSRNYLRNYRRSIKVEFGSFKMSFRDYYLKYRQQLSFMRVNQAILFQHNANVS